MTKETRTLSFVEWAQADFTLYKVLPEVKSQDDLTKVLMVAQVVRDAISTRCNWLKDFYPCWEIMTWEEKIALKDFLARRWIRVSYELRRQAPEEWHRKFKTLTNMIVWVMPLSDEWIESMRAITILDDKNMVKTTLLYLERDLEPKPRDHYSPFAREQTKEERAREEASDAICRANIARLRQEFGLKEPDRPQR